MLKENQIELIGVPGSGKSSLLTYIVGSRRLVSYRSAMKYASGRWFTTEIMNVPLASFFSNEIILKYYLSRPKATIRSLALQHPELVAGISLRLEAGTEGESIGAARYLEHMASIFEVFGISHLVNNYFKQDIPIVFDEYWTQLLLLKLQWGNSSNYESWLIKTASLAPLPKRIVWLKNAASVAEERQVGRKKIALSFSGYRDIKNRCIELERSIQWGLSLLSNTGVTVLELDSEAGLAENAKRTIEWIRQ